jgi:hypothetical protein
VKVVQRRGRAVADGEGHRGRGGGDLDDVQDTFHYQAGFNESYALNGTGQNNLFTIDFSGGGSASRSDADQGTSLSQDPAGLDSEAGTQLVNETFTENDGMSAGTSVDQTVSTSTTGFTLDNLSETDSYTSNDQFNDQGTVSVTASDATSDTVADLEQFTTANSLDQNLTVTVADDARPVADLSPVRRASRLDALADLCRNGCEDLRPLAGLRLAEQAHRRIPGAILPVQQPAPVR